MSRIRQSAKGENCAVRIPGVCLHHPETVVFAHANGSAAGKGIGMKCPDLIGAYCCFACHDVYDRRKNPPQGLTHDDIKLMFADGVFRTQRLLEEKGLLKAA
jgi:hypothetical protein